MMIFKESMVVYKLTNIHNGMAYIGQTSTVFSKRIKQHKNLKINKCPYLKNAIKKYGFYSFKIEILHRANSRDELNRLEIEAIKTHGTLFPGGYNLKAGGHQGGMLSAESRKKLSNSLKGKRLSDEAKKKLSLAFSGSKHPQYGKPVSEITKLKISQSLKGKKYKNRSDQHRKKISENNKKRQGHLCLNISRELQKKPIKCLVTGKVYVSVAEASKELQTSTSNICKQLKNKIKHIKGRKFQYLETKDV